MILGLSASSITNKGEVIYIDRKGDFEMGIMDRIPMTITASLCRLCKKMRKAKYFKESIQISDELPVCITCQGKVDRAKARVMKRLIN